MLFFSWQYRVNLGRLKPDLSSLYWNLGTLGPALSLQSLFDWPFYSLCTFSIVAPASIGGRRLNTMIPEITSSPSFLVIKSNTFHRFCAIPLISLGEDNVPSEPSGIPDSRSLNFPRTRKFARARSRPMPSPSLPARQFAVMRASDYARCPKSQQRRDHSEHRETSSSCLRLVHFGSTQAVVSVTQMD